MALSQRKGFNFSWKETELFCGQICQMTFLLIFLTGRRDF